MKNIHILPTDKPSRLYFDVVTKELLLQDKTSTNPTSFPIEKRNIYITNSEEIKDGDWYLYCNQINKRTRKNPRAEYPYPSYQKIILTTDKDLIKNSVQPIDDEFLEWFVKNPSCEKVKTEYGCCKQCDERLCEVFDLGLKQGVYKIIIPKEEPKKKHIVMLVGDKVNEEPKQETLEEFKKK